MTPRAPKPEAQEGFIIIEVLVSALILAIVAGAVLTLITATTRGAAAQRDRSVAYDVAQADQARMRTMRLTEINGTETRTAYAKSNGTEYTVVSERVYVNNKAGAVSCAKGTETPDYVQLTSTVSSPTMLHPVVLQSVVSPSTGSLNPNYGALDFTTNNALDEPVSGVTITLAGGRSATTGAEGCAIFPSLPKATYTVLYEGKNLINEEGKSTWSEPVTVVPGKVEFPTSPLRWDRPATLRPEFVYVEPGTGTLRPAPVDSMYVVNATSGKPATVIGTPSITAPRSAIQVDEAVFPFKSPSEYTVYAGSCTSNNPGTVGANKEGLYSAVVPPAAVLTPQIHVPAMELTVTTKSGPEGKSGTEQVLSGVAVTLTDLKCKSSGTNVKRAYTTNAEGHLSSGKTGPTEAGVPFGTYKVCALATVNGETRRAEEPEVKVENFTAGTAQKPGGTVLKLNLVKGSGAC